METFTIRQAAERCEVNYQAVRKRVDRGSIQVVQRDGVRRIPRQSLSALVSGPALERVRRPRSSVSSTRTRS